MRPTRIRNHSWPPTASDGGVHIECHHGYLGGRPDTADFGAAAVVQQDHVGKGDTDEAAGTIFEDYAGQVQYYGPSVFASGGGKRQVTVG
jgi:hypothetical protein